MMHDISPRRFGISAGILAAAVFAGQAHALAQTVPATAPARFNGWVSITTEEPGAMADSAELPGIEQNLQTGELVQRTKQKDKLAISYQNPVTGEDWEYDPEKNLIQRRDIWPMERLDIAQSKEVPITYDELLADLHITMGDISPKVTHSTECGMDRYDFEYPPYTHPFLRRGLAGDFGSATPRTVWTDPSTHRIREVVSDNPRGGEHRVLVAFSQKELRSIFDAGAPHSAKVEDLRMKPEWATVFDRVEAHANKPFPDGLMVRVQPDYTPGNDQGNQRLMLYTQAGKIWMVREYDVTRGLPNVDQIQIPDDWSGAGIPELFRRLSNVYPVAEEGGDGKTAWGGGYNLQTGEKEHEEQVGEETVPLGNPNGAGGVRISIPRNVKLPGFAPILGVEALDMEMTEGSAINDIYPRDALNARYTSAEIVSILTDPSRPGQICLRIVRDPPPRRGRAGGIGHTYEYWLDPTHADRPTSYLVSEKDHGTGDPDPQPISTLEFGGYQQFPAPDGRSFPTTWTRTAHSRSADGKVTDRITTKVIQLYFPNRAMPPLPAMPTTLPAHRAAPRRGAPPATDMP